MKFLYIICRAIDYRVGKTDFDKPEDLVLSRQEAWIAFSIKLFLLLLNITTCTAVIINVIHHW